LSGAIVITGGLLTSSHPFLGQIHLFYFIFTFLYIHYSSSILSIISFIFFWLLAKLPLNYFIIFFFFFEFIKFEELKIWPQVGARAHGLSSFHFVGVNHMVWFGNQLMSFSYYCIVIINGTYVVENYLSI